MPPSFCVMSRADVGGWAHTFDRCLSDDVPSRGVRTLASAPGSSACLGVLSGTCVGQCVAVKFWGQFSSPHGWK